MDNRTLTRISHTTPLTDGSMSCNAADYCTGDPVLPELTSSGSIIAPGTWHIDRSLCDDEPLVEDVFEPWTVDQWRRIVLATLAEARKES